MEIGFDANYIKDTMNKIEYDLICMLEINISNGVFVENGMPVHIDGKSIRYPKIETNGTVDRYSINYDPFMNRKVAHYLFNKYAIIRQIEDPSFRISSFYISKYLNSPDYSYAACSTNKGIIMSKAFTNESVCWINLIFEMENYKIDTELFKAIDTHINIERLMYQKEKEEAKKNAKRRS